MNSVGITVKKQKKNWPEDSSLLNLMLFTERFDEVDSKSEIRKFWKENSKISFKKFNDSKNLNWRSNTPKGCSAFEKWEKLQFQKQMSFEFPKVETIRSFH